MRLEYVPNPPTILSPEEQGIVERVKARRGSKGLIPLDLTLLHAPRIADGKSFAANCILLSSQAYQSCKVGTFFLGPFEPKLP